MTFEFEIRQLPDTIVSRDRNPSVLSPLNSFR